MPGSVRRGPTHSLDAEFRIQIGTQAEAIGDLAAHHDVQRALRLKSGCFETDGTDARRMTPSTFPCKFC